MIRITYSITNLPIPGGHDLLYYSMPDEMKAHFAEWKPYVMSIGGKITPTGDAGWRKDYWDFPDRATLENARAYANSHFDFDQFYADYVKVVESIGATITRTEEELPDPV